MKAMSAIRNFLSKVYTGFVKCPSIVNYACVALLTAFFIFLGNSIIAGTQRSEATSRAVSLRFKNIGELVTQSGTYTNVQVLRNERQVLGVSIPFTQSHYIYSYDGEIKAGIDFSAISFSVDDSAHLISVSIPEVKIFSNEIKADSLTIYDESKNIFTPLKLDNFNESLTQLKAESETTAINNGLFESALENAKILIQSFLYSAYDPAQYSIQFMLADSDT